MPRIATAERIVRSDDEASTTRVDDLIQRGRSQGHLSLAELRTACDEAGLTPAEGRSILRELSEAGVRLANELTEPKRSPGSRTAKPAPGKARATEQAAKPAEVAEPAAETGDESDVDAHGVVLSLQRVRHLRVLGDAAKALGAGAKVGDLGNGEEHVLAAGAVDRLAEVHETIAFLMRERLEQHAAHDAEDRRVGTDPQAEGDDDREGEPAGAGEGAERVLQIGEKHG